MPNDTGSGGRRKPGPKPGSKARADKAHKKTGAHKRHQCQILINY